MPIFTIGYSVKPIEEFIAKLQEFEITIVADVRSKPYSRWNRNFNQNTLIFVLQKHNIEYLYFGGNLGGLSVNTDFEKSIEKIILLQKDKNIVLMCVEKDPKDCHRYQTLTPEFEKRECKVTHILWQM